jgi:hypothetical protein
MWQCYEQSGPWADGSILLKHQRESLEGYARRKAMFCSPSVYTQMINTFGIIYAHAPARSWGSKKPDEVYSEFINDAGQGLNLSSLLDRALKMSEVQGSSFLVMDTMSIQPGTFKEMVEQRTYPFLDIVSADRVKSLAVDAVGNILEFAYEFMLPTGFSLTPCIKIIRPGMIDYCDYEGTNLKHTELPYETTMPVIPIVASNAPLRTSELPPSPTQGLFQSQASIAHTNSLMDESLYSQQFGILVVTGKNNTADLKLGSSNGLSLAEGSTASFIQPNGTAIDKMLQRIDTAYSFMVRTFANLITSSESQSGVAKQIDRQVGALMLKGVAGYMEGVEVDVYRLFQEFVDSEIDYDYTVTYYKDFDLGDIASYIMNAVDMLGVNVTEETKAFIRADLVKKFLSQANQDEAAKLVALEMNNQSAPKSGSIDDMDSSSDDEE